MSNLVKHAKRELELIGAFDEEGDFYGGMTGKAVMELIEVFAKQGHSGMSAGIVRQLFNKLANYEPMSPLTFEDDEWTQHNNFKDEPKGAGGCYQNRRNSAVFKEGKDGKPYYINAHVQRDQKGSCWQGTLTTPKGTLYRCYIKDPANMPKITIDIIDWEVNKDDESVKKPGSGWWIHKMKHPKQLEELEKYYELAFRCEHGKDMTDYCQPCGRIHKA